MQPQALLFNFLPMETAMIKNTLAASGLSVVLPSPEQYAQPLGALAGEKLPLLPPGSQQRSLTEPVLVFCYCQEAALDQALDSLRNARLAGKALKAVLTPANRFWNVFMLAQELRKEREAIQRQRNH